MTKPPPTHQPNGAATMGLLTATPVTGADCQKLIGTSFRSAPTLNALRLSALLMVMVATWSALS